MKKPAKQTIEAYDYQQCREYINDKYDIDMDDYAGWSKSGLSDDVPFQSFWHFVCDRCGVINDSYIWMRSEMFDIDSEEDYWKCEEWQAKIGNMFGDEFAEKDAEGNWEIKFWVTW